MARRERSPLRLQPSNAGIPVLLGAVGGLLFLFVFPGGAITTLMHDVMHLPGPGAGIALILGPAVLLIALISSQSVRGATGGALLASLAFAATYGVLAAILNVSVSRQGMFGSIWFVVALGVCGVVTEVLLILTRGLRSPWRLLLAACGANTGLLVFYWIAIFPRTKGWVSWEDLPLLLALNLGGGAIAGVAAWVVSSRIPILAGSSRGRESDVRTR